MMAVLDRSQVLFGPALRAAVDTLPGSLRHITGYHLGWWDSRGREEHGGGKALRPALVLLAAEAVGGQVEAAMPAAVAVELVHNFSLLHDDVMDGDEVRRHRTAAWKVFGVAPAILAGDAMLNLAFRVLTDARNECRGDGSRMLAAAVTDLLEGQEQDLGFEERHEIAVAEGLRMARLKTGSLLEYSCGLGALFGGADSTSIGRLRTFGADLGLAFQIVDDYLGIWGDPRRTGKPVHSDLLRRKMTLPVAVALNSETKAGKELAAAYRSGDEQEAHRLARLVEAAGGREWCLAEAIVLLERSLAVLRAGLPAARLTELTNLARFIVHRDR